MIWLYLWIAVNAGFFAGWIAGSEHQWRAERKTPLTTRLYGRRDEWGS